MPKTLRGRTRSQTRARQEAGSGETPEVNPEQAEATSSRETQHHTRVREAPLQEEVHPSSEYTHSQGQSLDLGPGEHPIRDAGALLPKDPEEGRGRDSPRARETPRGDLTWKSTSLGDPRFSPSLFTPEREDESSEEETLQLLSSHPIPRVINPTPSTRQLGRNPLPFLPSLTQETSEEEDFEDSMATEKWSFSGEEGGLTLKQFILRFSSKRSAVYDRMAPLDPGNKDALRARQMQDFNAIPRYISGPALTRFQQEAPIILATMEETSDPELEEAERLAREAFKQVEAAKTQPVARDYYVRWAEARIAWEEAQDAARFGRTSTMKEDPVGRLFAQWESYFPENTAENQLKFTNFGWIRDESPSNVYIRLHELCEQLVEQL